MILYKLYMPYPFHNPPILSQIFYSISHHGSHRVIFFNKTDPTNGITPFGRVCFILYRFCLPLSACKRRKCLVGHVHVHLCHQLKGGMHAQHGHA